jgi:hypothetical protein
MGPRDDLDATTEVRIDAGHDGACAERSGAERRQAPREPGRCTVRCRLVTPEGVAGEWVAWVADVSAKGIALILPHRFEHCAPLELELVDPPPGCPSVRRRALVVHATPREPGVWLVGAAFGTPLTPWELQQLRPATPDVRP